MLMILAILDMRVEQTVVVVVGDLNKQCPSKECKTMKDLEYHCNSNWLPFACSTYIATVYDDCCISWTVVYTRGTCTVYRTYEMLCTRWICMSYSDWMYIQCNITYTPWISTVINVVVVVTICEMLLQSSYCRRRGIPHKWWQIVVVVANVLFGVTRGVRVLAIDRT